MLCVCGGGEGGRGRGVGERVAGTLTVALKETILHKKTMSYAINSHVLTGRNPCIDKTIHVLLIHGFVVLRISGHS